MNYAMTKQVSKVQKRGTKFYGRLIFILCIVFIIMGIIFSRGMFLPAFLLAAFYFYFTLQTVVDYEYHMEDGILTVDVIKGKRRRKRAMEVHLKDMEVVAPNWHEAVAKYRKNGGTIKLKKYDYTSYNDDIPYYTMIVYRGEEKIKILLDLDVEWLRAIKMVYPQKVFME